MEKEIEIRERERDKEIRDLELEREIIIRERERKEIDSLPEAREEVRVHKRYTDTRRKRDKLWTEISKDLVVREALERAGYEFDETENFYYVFEYLRYVSPPSSFFDIILNSIFRTTSKDLSTSAKIYANSAASESEACVVSEKDFRHCQ